MDKERNCKVALVLYTQGIDYDDRIRKEILSVKKLYSNVEFKIFAVEPKNREEEGVSSYGIPYRIPYLKSRDRYASGTKTLAKAYDFFKTIKKELKGFDAVWCADIETFIFVLLLHGKPIAWDLHELPGPFMEKAPMKYLFRRLESKCAVMIHANELRLKLLEEIGMVKYPEKQFVLRNYPQFDEFDTEYDDTYNAFDRWLGEGKCVYLQGLMGKTRAGMESISAVMAMPELKAVVVGKFDAEMKDQLVDTFGKESLENNIFFTGQIKQLKTSQYIKRCFMSLVFYKNTSPNNYYCEPNRLFQNIIHGNPVVVGNNPPMKELVEKYEIGVSIDDDGSDVNKIVKGIKQVIENYDSYKANLSTNAKQWHWDSQDEIIGKITEKLLR